MNPENWASCWQCRSCWGAIDDMYLDLVNEFRTTRKYGDEIRPRPPVSAKDISCAEQQLGIRFPQELIDLLLEMDGDCDLFLGLDDIIQYNGYQYSENYPIGSLLFFGADGAGNLFAYKVEEKEAKSGEIYLWDHEIAVWGPKEDELRYQADSLLALIQDYYSICYSERLSE